MSTMSTKKLILVSLVSTAFAAATMVKANSVILYQDAFSAPAGGFPAGSMVTGGEFEANTSPQSFLAAYSPLVQIGGGFTTFCASVNDNFYTTLPYTYGLSQMDNDPNVPLTMGAAYLYSLFGKGLLNYDYLNIGAGPGGTTRVQDAGLLQAALWQFLGGQSWPGDPFDPTTNPYYLQAIAHLGAGAYNPSAGSFDVSIMNLTVPIGSGGYDGPTGFEPEGSIAQAQMVLVAPDGGSTVLMLGGAMTVLALVGARCRKLAA
jgi:hypothetical protein